MPHSLRARLSGLRYKKIISDKDYDRICKALDNENVLDKIRAEIGQYEANCRLQGGTDECEKCNSNVFGSIYQIIDKYKAESEDKA